MNFANLPALQAFMRERRIDAWLIHDFRASNSLLARLLPSPPGVHRWTTRRVDFCIRAVGEPVVLTHHIDAAQFVRCGVKHEVYLSWREYQCKLAGLIDGCPRVAMEYSPGGLLPAMSVADAGTVEFVRSLGAEVVSSADLVQVSAAAWSDEALREHLRVSKLVGGIKDEAFGLIRTRLRAKVSIAEHEAAAFIRDRFKAEGLEWLDGPIVAVNGHAGDPHFEPSADRPTSIRMDDWVLIDLWARTPSPTQAHIFSDITWVGFAGKSVPARHARAFGAVKAARDAALRLAQQSWKKKQAVQGWQLDDAARNELVAAGYEGAVRHRTGHSLSPGPLVHGLGMNLDNLETRDTRTMLARTGFTIEPGVYMPAKADGALGVRLEINVYVDPKRGPIVTSGVQEKPVMLG